ncbi:hypothetical protein GCK32_021243 [Trichostrongylus colubriformis]|uniref:Uncharacterized protein n=1 Tax=Trichostrongylus colubriformis TaxID=6319 RepID=A0AAN8ERK3_TRICO
MALDGNERRFTVDETHRLRRSSPPDSTATANVVVLRPQRLYGSRGVTTDPDSRQDNSPQNRHSYHGATASLISPVGRDRLSGSLYVPKRFSQPSSWQHSCQGSEPYSLNHIHTILEQVSALRFHFYKIILNNPV